MKKKLFLIAVALVVICAATGGALYYAYPVQVALFAAKTRNYILSWSAPRGTTTTELNAAYKDARALALTPAPWTWVSGCRTPHHDQRLELTRLDLCRDRARRSHTAGPGGPLTLALSLLRWR
mgnify:CR=1 FL=1